MIIEEKTISSERIYEGRILKLRKDTVEAAGGKATREIIEHGGAVALVPVTADGKVVLIRQYRKPAEKIVLEIPAGKLEQGENPLDAAARELKEETGFTAQNFVELSQFYPAIGYSEEIIHVYLCTGLVPGETDFDEDEMIENEIIDLERAYKMAVSGQIEDGKTIIGITQVWGRMMEMKK